MLRKSLLLLQAVARGSRWLLFMAADSLCFFHKARLTSTVLVIRLDALGDYFIWIQSGAMDVAEFARRSGTRSVLLANGVWAELARNSQLWDEVIDFHPSAFVRNPFYRLGLLRKIRALGASLLIQPRPGRVFLQEDSITRISGAPTRIGSDGTLINISQRLRRFGNRYYSRLIPVDQGRQVHELVRNRAFTLALTGACDSRFKLEHDIEQTDRVIVALGAGQAGRVWPVEKLIPLLRHVNKNYSHLKIVLLGTESEAAAARLIQLSGLSNMESRVACTSLQEYTDAVAEAGLVICNDSSAYHIAMAFGRKVVCFLGGGHFGWYAPYPKTLAEENAVVLYQPMACYWCNWKCIYPRRTNRAFKCVQDISLSAATAAVDRLLHRHPHPALL